MANTNSGMKKQENNTWDNEIRDLEQFFGSQVLPEKVRLNSWSMIVNVKHFVTNHLATVKHNNGNERFEPYLNRLKELKKQLTNDRQV